MCFKTRQRKTERIDAIALLALYGALSACQWSCNNNDTTASSDRFSAHVRTTEHQTPEEEMAGFKLPPGFEVTLFASEPDITKPINMEFDDRGRLWVSQSSEYPIAAGPGNGTDRISVLEDTDGDGKADKFTHFGDSLDIPIGVMPVVGGAVGFSIPYLYRFSDNDGDGRADIRKPMIGPFEHKDTHGMVNNLTRGFDGWIHACHGFTNVSTIAGSDGDSITMVSGNTFRFRPDGSRVELTTNGRINPFGMSFDERGYLYSVDCHSKPIFQLIPGGDYPQWGRKDPSIGYAPEMMSYELGSTALSGLVYYSSVQFPEAYRGSFFTGDVVTCRIDRNTVEYHGSTPAAKKEEPFLTSEDPWFRPVDIKIGPDGSLYVADFYNRIIGHYEVSLDHPGRDRLSGRIWKITYTGKDKGTVPVRDWSQASVEEVIDGLEHPQLVTRLKLADRLVEVIGQGAVMPLLNKLQSASLHTEGRVHAMWVLHRLQALPDNLLDSALEHDDPLIRQHALRILRESSAITTKQAKLVQEALLSSDPFIQRTAAEVLDRFPNTAGVLPLLDLYQHCPAEDSHLKYTALLALRNSLREPDVVRHVVSKVWEKEKRAVLARALRDVPTAKAAGFVLDYLLNHEVTGDELQRSLEFAGRFAVPQSLERAVPVIKARFSMDLPAQLDLFLNIRDGIAQRGDVVPRKIADWGIGLAYHFLDSAVTKDTWMSHPLQDRQVDLRPWVVSDAFLTQVKPAFRIYLSERNGYPPMAMLYSRNFALPKHLAMNVFDNDVHHLEEKVGVSRNVVRIRLASTDEVIAEYRAKQDEPMEFDDLIKEVALDLTRYAGQQGYIQVVDSTETGSIGIGKLEPAVVEMPPYTPSDLDERRMKAATVAGGFGVKGLRGRLVDIVKTGWVGTDVRLAAIDALTNMSAETDLELFGAILLDTEEPLLLRERSALSLGQIGNAPAIGYLRKALAAGARPIQLAASMALSRSRVGIHELLTAIETQGAPADLLAEFKVKEAWSAHASPALRLRAEKLLERNGDERQARKQLIEQRIAEFTNTGSRVTDGKVLFEANCASCHQVAGSGGLIGPQLDGIGNWGVQALTEKILDPNRNISESFRTYNIKLTNGKQQSGLYRRTEGEVLIFADISGTEFRVAKRDMESYTPSPYTLMPDQFRHTLSDNQFGALMEYLLQIK